MRPQDENPLSFQRLALFFVVSMAVFIGWSLLFPPELPPPPDRPDAPGSPAPASLPGATASERAPEFGLAAVVTSIPALPADLVSRVVEEPVARRQVVSLPEAEIEFTNVGGRVAGWRLRGHGEYGARDRPLDVVVHPLDPGAAAASDLSRLAVADDAEFLPLQVITGVEAIDRRLAAARHVVERRSAAGTEAVIEMTWSDGEGLATFRRLAFHEGGLVAVVEAAVFVDGRAISFHLGWGPGLGNHTQREREGTYFRRGHVAFSADGKTSSVGRPSKAGRLETATVSWAALQDSFFAAMFVPAVFDQAGRRGQASGFRVTGTLPSRPDGRPQRDSDRNWADHLVLAAPFSPAQPWQSLYVGPSDRSILQRLEARFDGQRNLIGLLEFGWVQPIAVIMYELLVWLHARTQSWGAAILLLTLIIRAVLFPLTHFSLKKMRVLQEKMKVVKPKQDAIRERYRKQPRTLDTRQREQQELLALFQSSGINPGQQLMGCLPLLLSLPFFWALFRLLPQAAEFRYQPFLVWSDLASADPSHAWPILTGVTMFVSSKLSIAQAPTMDPMQRNMLYVFPLMFTWFCWSAPLGLVVYWTTSNVIQIGQQLLLNYTLPPMTVLVDKAGSQPGPGARRARAVNGETSQPPAVAGPDESAARAPRGRKKRRRR